MSGWWSSRPASSLIAFTSRAPAANDPVRKYAHTPSPSTRQSSTPSDSWNCVGLIRSVIRFSMSTPGEQSPQPLQHLIDLGGLQGPEPPADQRPMASNEPGNRDDGRP